MATGGLLIDAPGFSGQRPQGLGRDGQGHPGKLELRHRGPRCDPDLAADMLKQVAGDRLLHVPFRTSPKTITAVLGKQVDVIIDTVSAVPGRSNWARSRRCAVTGKDRFRRAERAGGDRVRACCRL